MYELKLFSNTGNFLTFINNYTSIEIGRQKNDVGTASIIFPFTSLMESYFKEDYLLEIYRKGKLLDNTLWILQKIFIDESNKTIEVVFYDHLTLLERRWNVWFKLKDTSLLTQYPTQFQQPLDDICKMVVYHNYKEGAIDATNNTQAPVTISIAQPTAIIAFGGVNRVNNLIFIDNYLSQAPVGAIQLTEKNLLSCCKEIVNLSQTLDTNLWFDFIYTPSLLFNKIGTLLFKTWTFRKGNIIKYNISSSLLSNVKVTTDYSNNANLIFAFGKDVLPEASTFEDQISEYYYEHKDSLFYPKEHFVSNTEYTFNTLLQGFAQTEFNKKRTISKLTGELNTQILSFFDRINYGDIIYINRNNTQFISEINKYVIRYENNSETITIPFESIDSIQTIL